MSGNVDLWNEGCMELVRVCKAMTDTKLNLAACGMEAPLSSELCAALSTQLARKTVEVIGNRLDKVFGLSEHKQSDRHGH